MPASAAKEIANEKKKNSNQRKETTFCTDSKR